MHKRNGRAAKSCKKLNCSFWILKNKNINIKSLQWPFLFVKFIWQWHSKVTVLLMFVGRHISYILGGNKQSNMLYTNDKNSTLSQLVYSTYWIELARGHYGTCKFHQQQQREQHFQPQYNPEKDRKVEFFIKITLIYQELNTHYNKKHITEAAKYITAGERKKIK